MAFHDVRFPVEISYGSKGSLEWSTDVVMTAGGQRAAANANWTQPLRRFDVAHNIKSQAQLDEIRNFHMGRAGRLHSFRYKDWSDYSMTDETQGTAAILTERAFYLRKTYTSGSQTLVKKITKPISGTLTLKVNGAAKSEGEAGDFTANYATGVVTFNEGKEPTGEDVIKVTCEFDLHCYFDTDEIQYTFSFYQHYDYAEIALVEVKE